MIKRLAQLSLIGLALFFMVRTVLITGIAQSPEAMTQERKLNPKGFKNAPVVIHKVRSLKSDTWHKDLEIEVKNISDKPIYFMLAYLIFEDEKRPDGEAGIPLMYGDPKRNGRIDRYTHLEDEHLKPGEFYVFTIPELYKKGFKAKHEKFLERTKNLKLEFAIINFGDGTGFEAGRFLDLNTNHNGVSKSGDLRSLPQQGVATLELDYKESKRVDSYGNRFRYHTKVDDAVADAKGTKAGR